MAKPRVVFPFTEAGLGHIMPMNSIADEFERLYGDKVEVVRSAFFTETGDESLKKYEKRLTKSVKSYNKVHAFGFFATFNMDFWGTRLSTWGACKFIADGADKKGIAHMRELKPDLVFSTHWATNYYAIKMGKERPLTVMYCPDAKINPLFRYPCDMVMVSTFTGYERALKRHRVRFNKDNLKQVPFLIRKEAFEVEKQDKRALREKLSLDPDKFTVVMADGGYGLGLMKPMCEELLQRDLPINLVAVCGKNEELFGYLKNLGGENTVFKPMGLIDNMLEVIACADICCGKSGASLMAEPCFFGIPQIITHYANDIERWIGKYYVETVGSAMKIFNAKKACDKIEEFLAYPPLLSPYINAAKSQHSNYGAEKCARYIFELLCTRFPDLKEDEEK